MSAYDDLAGYAARNIWNFRLEHDADLGAIPGMIVLRERRLLRWLAQYFFRGNGYIIDAGSYLGASAFAFGMGLSHRSPPPRHRKCILSFDRFSVPGDSSTRRLLPNDREVGDSFLDLFEENTRPYVHWIEACPGDILDLKWPRDQMVEILFVDIAKSWAINQHVIDQFFPALVPGRSLIVQQDFNHPWLPWVSLAMEYFRDYFDILADERSSRLFLYRKPIPREKLAVRLEDLPFAEKDRLLLDAIDGAGNFGKPRLMVARAVLHHNEGRTEEAVATISGMHERFADAEGVIELVKMAMRRMERQPREERPEGGD